MKMTQAYEYLLAQKPIILDGGMGQELVRRMPKTATNLWSAQILMDYPHLIEELHLEFIQSGCHIITLSNYSCTPERLARDARVDLFDILHQKAIKSAQNAYAKHTDQPVAIAGSLPPLVASYHPETAPPFSQAVESYRRLVDIQKTDIDLFICETVSNMIEARAAVTAAKENSDLPIWVSFCLDDKAAHTLPSGDLLSDAVQEMANMDVQAILLNCIKPETIPENIAILKQFNGLTGAYPNAFCNATQLKAGGTVAHLKKRDDFSVTQYADAMVDYHKNGLDILGGCCEITPEHICCMREKLIL